MHTCVYIYIVWAYICAYVCGGVGVGAKCHSLALSPFIEVGPPNGT